MMTSSSDACGDESLYGDFSIDLGASCTTPRKSSSSESISSISFDASYASVFGQNVKSSSSNLCYSRWESLGDSNNSTIIGLLDRDGSNNKLPSVIFISRGEAATTCTAQAQRAVMAIKMPQRQETSHIRTTPLSRASSGTSSTLSFGDFMESIDGRNDEEEEQQQQQRLVLLPPRHTLLTGSEKSGGFGLAIGASNHTFAAYSSVGPSNHTFEKVYSKVPSNHYTLAQTSNHTFASFASSNHCAGGGTILTICESVEKIVEEEDSTVASFSADTATSRASSKQSNHHVKVMPRHRRRHSIGDNGVSSSCRIHSVAGGHDQMVMQRQ